MSLGRRQRFECARRGSLRRRFNLLHFQTPRIWTTRNNKTPAENLFPFQNRCGLQAASELPFSPVLARYSNEQWPTVPDPHGRGPHQPGAPMQGHSEPPSPPHHPPRLHRPRVTAPGRLCPTGGESRAGRDTPLFLLAGGHQKRGDHRNDRSTAQRCQSNHVNTTSQFILRPPSLSLFGILGQHHG